MNFSTDFFNTHFSLWMFLLTVLHPQNFLKSVLAFLKEHSEVLMDFIFLLSLSLSPFTNFYLSFLLLSFFEQYLPKMK